MILYNYCVTNLQIYKCITRNNTNSIFNSFLHLFKHNFYNRF